MPWLVNGSLSLDRVQFSYTRQTHIHRLKIQRRGGAVGRAVLGEVVFTPTHAATARLQCAGRLQGRVKPRSKTARKWMNLSIGGDGIAQSGRDLDLAAGGGGHGDGIGTLRSLFLQEQT